MDQVKTIIRSLLTSTPITLNMQQLSRDYRNQIGDAIPFQQFGYSSLESFLLSIPDVVQLQGTGPCAQVHLVSSEKSAHIDKLVTKQKMPKKLPKSYLAPKKYAPTKSNIKVKAKMAFPISERPFKNKSQNSYCKQQNVKSETPVVPAKNLYPTCQPEEKTTSDIPATTDTENKLCMKPREKISFSIKPVVNELETTNSFKSRFKISKTITPPYIKPDEIINQPTDLFSKQSLLVHEERVQNFTPKIQNSNIKPKISSLAELNRLHTKSQNESLELSNKLSEKSQLETNKSETGNNFKEPGSIANEIKKIAKFPSRTSDKHIPYIVQQNLKTLIKNFPDGILSSEIGAEYKKLFRSELRHQELGYKNVKELCSSLTSVFSFSSTSTEDVKFFDKNRKVDESSILSNCNWKLNVSDNNDVLPAVIDWNDIKGFLPQDIVNFDEEIPRQFIPESSKEDDNINICMGEVYDISKFWVYLNDGSLDTLMDQLQHFYQAFKDKYYIPKNLIKKGMYCVQLFFQEYHRAKIVDIITRDMIKVYFIDYGTTANVTTNGLCFLQVSFAKLPAQAIRCRLANIQPVEEDMPWSRKSTRRFRQFLDGRAFAAKVMKIDIEWECLGIYLCDITNSNDYFYVNDELVKEGHAVYIDEEQIKCNHYVEVTTRNIYLYPTFYELEYGVTPSTHEIESLGEDVAFNFIYPQYFKKDITAELAIIENRNKFHESYLLTHRKQFFANLVDLRKIKMPPTNMSRFGEMQSEIKSYLTDYEKEVRESEVVGETTDVNELDENKNVVEENKNDEKEIVRDVENKSLKAIQDLLELMKSFSLSRKEVSEVNAPVQSTSSLQTINSGPVFSHESVEEISDDFYSLNFSIKSVREKSNNASLVPLENGTSSLDLRTNLNNVTDVEQNNNPFKNLTELDTNWDKSLVLNANNPFLSFIKEDNGPDATKPHSPDESYHTAEETENISSSTNGSTTNSVKSLELVRQDSVKSHSSRDSTQSMHSSVQIEKRWSTNDGLNNDFVSIPNNVFFNQQTSTTSSYLQPMRNGLFVGPQQTPHPYQNYMQYYNVPVPPQGYWNSYPQSTALRPPPGFASNDAHRNSNQLFNVGGNCDTRLKLQLEVSSSLSSDFYEKYNQRLMVEFQKKNDSSPTKELTETNAQVQATSGERSFDESYDYTEETERTSSSTNGSTTNSVNSFEPVRQESEKTHSSLDSTPSMYNSVQISKMWSTNDGSNNDFVNIPNDAFYNQQTCTTSSYLQPMRNGLFVGPPSDCNQLFNVGGNCDTGLKLQLEVMSSLSSDFYEKYNQRLMIDFQEKTYNS